METEIIKNSAENAPRLADQASVLNFLKKNEGAKFCNQELALQFGQELERISPKTCKLLRFGFIKRIFGKGLDGHVRSYFYYEGGKNGNHKRK